jgi:hypothetical protein
MSSGKPQTRGLAALLRIEKERRAREGAGEDESASPVEVEERPAPPETSAPPREPETAAESNSAAPASPDEVRESPAEVSEGAGAEGRAVAAPGADDAVAPPVEAAAPAKGGEGGRSASAPFPARVPDSPPPRRAQTRSAGAPRKSLGAQTEPAPAPDPGWEKFVADWRPFLRQGVKFKLCEFFYRNTVGAGRRQFTTSTAQLSRVSGAHRRHIFLVLRQLEELRFIRKESVETNRKDEGLVISFFPDRQT